MVFDYKKDYKLFKFGIIPSNSVQFSAKSWNMVDVEKINLKQLAVKFYSSQAVVTIKIS